MQPPGGARLSVKPLPKNLILRVRCRQQLHCHHTVHDGVLGLIYLAEPAPAQQPPQPVVPEPRPRTQTQRGVAIGRLLHHTITLSARRR
jgi:hypothetical protein